MRGTVDTAVRGAIEASEGGGGVSRKPIQQVLRAWKGAEVKGVVWDHAAFPKGKAVEKVGLRRVYQLSYVPRSILRSGYWRRFGSG